MKLNVVSNMGGVPCEGSCTMSDTVLSVVSNDTSTIDGAERHSIAGIITKN